MRAGRRVGVAHGTGEIVLAGRIEEKRRNLAARETASLERRHGLFDLRLFIESTGDDRIHSVSQFGL
jgi:hypothetical protein